MSSSSTGVALASVRSIAIGGTVWLRDITRRTRKSRLPWVSLIVMAILLMCAAFAPLLAPHDTGIHMLNNRVPPAQDWRHPLGTDIMGRDMLSRLIFGARTSVFISLTALATGGVVGTVLGLGAGYKGGWLDTIVMRAADIALGFPTILVAMIIVVLLGTGIQSIVIAVVLTVWARFARMIRGDVLSIKERDFVTLARIAGVSTPFILWRHVFPGTVNTLMVMTSLLLGQVILLEASLSYLGLGLPPGAPAWGIMVAEGRVEILNTWWLALFPGLTITIVVLAFNFFGDWLRDTLDPKLRRL